MIDMKMLRPVRIVALFLLAATLWTTPAGAQSALPRSQPQVVSASTRWSAPQARPGDQLVLAVQVEIQPGFHINPAAIEDPDLKDFLIPTQLTVLDAPAGLTFGPVQAPPVHHITVNYTGQPAQVPVYEGKVVFYLPVQVRPEAEAGAREINLRLRYQACDDRTCLRPDNLLLAQRLEVVAAGASEFPGVARAEPDPLFENFRADAPSLPGEAFEISAFGWRVRMNPYTAGGFGLVLLLAALGGMLLNFTPCVLPVIPIKVLSLSQVAGNRRRCLLLGLTMSLGVVVFWLGLGALIAAGSAALRAAVPGEEGEAAGLTSANQLFQYPWFTIGTGLVIAALAVGMCGLFAVRLPQWVYQISPRHDSYSGSLGFGVMTAVLSTPCTAPFMGGAAAWAVGQAHALTVLSIFAAIGAGMALPYTLLSAFPALIQRLPRTGPASEVIKQVMGLFMLAAAAYFVGTGVSSLLVDPPEPPGRGYWWAVAAFIAAGGLWMAWRLVRLGAPRAAQVMAVGLGALLLAGSIYGAARLTQRGPIDWVYYTPARLEQARAQGRTVVLEFTAEWCLNCKVLEAAVLHDQRVVQLLGQEHVVPIKVDLTGKNPAGNRLLNDVGRVMIPALVVMAPDGTHTLNSDAYTVAQVEAAVREALTAVTAAKQYP